LGTLGTDLGTFIVYTTPHLVYQDYRGNTAQTNESES
jgi:hypothetical protein